MLSIKASDSPTRRQRGRLGAFLLAACASATLAACGGGAAVEKGTVGAVTGFAGIAAADEPHATLAARDVLSAGGSAADAAVAAAFTMAVTLPSSMGLGGGGVCLVHNPETERISDRSSAEVLEFLPDLAPSDGQRYPAAVPALPRGLFALHAKYGDLRWETLLNDAEQKARLGFPASRALAKQFVAGGVVLRNDPTAVRTFADPRGMSPGEGTSLVQENLATTLARLRLRGVGDFYQGMLARELVESYRRAGFALTTQALANFRPRWVEPATTTRGNEIVAAPPVGVAGHGALQVFQAGGVAGAVEGGQPVPGAAGLLTVDPDGQAVACAFTLNGPFGTGRMAPGFGTMIAAPPPAPEQTRQPLAALLAWNPYVKEFHFAAVAGGTGAQTAVGTVAARTLKEDVPLGQAVEGVVAGRQDIAGQVSAAWCPKGAPSHVALCRVATDPRGSGYGMIAGQR
ncbi:gamma-glutamyltransferase [Caenispirillum salinarum]|uniref:gamma-glutamyltransferase n=1 Tax=Caenispirillum salinarum TaxID=859058 RepID=UPI001267180A|nr:gamma-glutamyltransferase [Caenispirillum salinarum]